MTTKFIDAVSLGDVSQDRVGNISAFAKTLRTGVQVYAGWEVGRPDMERVRVYRSRDEVEKSVQSFLDVAVTLDHPDEAVSPETWDDEGVGEVNGSAWLEGKWVHLPLKIRSQKAIDAIKSGKRGLSGGYECELLWGDGVTPEGESYDAQQINIIGNHVAICQMGRAGNEARIGDGVEDSGKDRARWGASPIITEDQEEPIMADKPLKTVTYDGVSIEVTDQGAQVITNLQAKLDDAETAHLEAISSMETEIGELKTKLKDAEAKAIADDKLDQMVADRAALVASVKAIDGKIETTGVKDADLRRRAVESKYGVDFAKDASDAEVAGMFKTIAKDAKEQKQPNPLSKAVKDSVPVNDGDDEVNDAYAKMIADAQSAYVAKAN